MISKKWKETLRRLGIGSLAALKLAGSIQITDMTTVDAKTASAVSTNDTDDTDDDSNSSTNTVEETRVSSTSEFLVVGDCAPTVNGRYGQPVHLILPIYNMGLEMVTNLIVTPVTSTKVEEWPFQLTTTGLVQAVDNIPASPNKEIAYQNRREVEWDLVVSKEAPTG